MSFKDINLYDNHMDNDFTDVSLRGRQITVQNAGPAPDLSTEGCFPKAWLRTEKGFRLLKNGGTGGKRDRTQSDERSRSSMVCRKRPGI